MTRRLADAHDAVDRICRQRKRCAWHAFSAHPSKDSSAALSSASVCDARRVPSQSQQRRPVGAARTMFAAGWERCSRTERSKFWASGFAGLCEPNRSAGSFCKASSAPASTSQDRAERVSDFESATRFRSPARAPFCRRAGNADRVAQCLRVHDLAVAHDEFDLPQIADILRWVAVDQGELRRACLWRWSPSCRPGGTCAQD